MSASLTKEQWQQIDPLIFACNILGAIQAIRSALGCGIVDAIEVHVERYRELRAEQPERFRCPHEEYWRETYS
jgi:hypothetical protein